MPEINKHKKVAFRGSGGKHAVMSDQTQVASATILVEVSSEPLELIKYTDFVADNGAGAIATFTGVTRDNFQGKVVQKLEYEAYGPMAEKMMEV